MQTVTPSVVSTQMTGFMPTSLFVPSPQTYVRSALATLGIQDTAHGYFPHSLRVRSYIQDFLARTCPNVFRISYMVPKSPIYNYLRLNYPSSFVWGQNEQSLAILD